MYQPSPSPSQLPSRRSWNLTVIPPISFPFSLPEKRNSLGIFLLHQYHPFSPHLIFLPLFFSLCSYLTGEWRLLLSSRFLRSFQVFTESVFQICGARSSHENPTWQWHLFLLSPTEGWRIRIHSRWEKLYLVSLGLLFLPNFLVKA